MIETLLTPNTEAEVEHFPVGDNYNAISTLTHKIIPTPAFYFWIQSIKNKLLIYERSQFFVKKAFPFLTL